MAAYSGYGKYGETSLFVTRFDTLSNQPTPLPEYRDVSLADAAADVGNDIVSHRSDYQTGDPQSVPYHWGNPSSDPGSPFFVKDARGNNCSNSHDLYRDIRIFEVHPRGDE